jgi:putative phosphoesterase
MQRKILGVISDTHGLLRPQAVEALRGSDLILHAGDIGRGDVLNALRQIAPVIAVRGNVDHGAWCEQLPLREVVDCTGLQIYMLHELRQLDLDPARAGFAAVLYGHSHKPEMRWERDVLYFNPGSAGPRRFDLPISVGRLQVNEGTISGELVTLQE